jgi:hypothetical protein
MLKVAIASILVLSCISPAVAQQQQYTVSGWPSGINELPCTAFRQDGPDSWTLIATVRTPHAMLSNVGFVHTGESKMIEAKCGSK